MRRLLVSIVVSCLAATLVVAGCSPAAPAPAQPAAAPPKAAEPTKAPAAPAAPAAKAAEPTKAPAAQPTAAPAPKVEFPVKGRNMTIIVPFAAGGPNDLAARTLGAIFEKELGVSVQVANKPGAGTQVGISELAAARPDGHTMAYTSVPTSLPAYLDPERKASYSGKDLQPIANHAHEFGAIAVPANSPFKTAKDLFDHAKANPGGVKVACNGIMTVNHIAILNVQKQLGIRFAVVQFDGAAPQMTALLGGHVDAAFLHVSPALVAPVRGGEARVLGVMSKDANRHLPEVPTFESQGFNVHSMVSYGLWTTAGAPMEGVKIMSGLVKKAIDDPEHQKRLSEAGMTLHYMDTPAFTEFWKQAEVNVKALIEEQKAK